MVTRAGYQSGGQSPHSKAKAPRAELLAAVPVRNPLLEWRVDEEPGSPVVVLLVPRRGDGIGRLLNRLFDAPEHRQVVLDELGTQVWRLCDGTTTVDGIVRALMERHRLQRREAEVSLTTYLETLARRGFIELSAGKARR